VKAAVEAALDRVRESVEDSVRLGEAGWKERYYADKYKSDDITEGGGRDRVFSAYIEGLCWVMRYYYSGCASWDWFYPFHYAPFASDLVNVDRFKVRFQLAEPFRPLDQLMGVLPPASAHALPVACRALMTAADSPILDFYPEKIRMDPNGKPMPWLWVVLLPFIDERRLLDAIASVEHTFSQEELFRNRRYGEALLFFHASSDLARAPTMRALVADCAAAAVAGCGGGDAEPGAGAAQVVAAQPPLICAGGTDDDFSTLVRLHAAGALCGGGSGGGGGAVREPILPSYDRGFTGFLRPFAVAAPLSARVAVPRGAPMAGRLSAVERNRVLCTVFEDPADRPHVPRLLDGALPAEPLLLPEDMVVVVPRLNRCGRQHRAARFFGWAGWRLGRCLSSCLAQL
jgi:hypothetical protein